MNPGSEVDEEGIAVGAKRADFLECLHGERKRIRDIVEELDYSRSTVNRAVKELETRGFIERTDGTFTTTATGIMAVREYREYVQRSGSILQAEPVLSTLESTSPLGREAVVSGEFSPVDGPHPTAQIERVSEAISTSDSIRVLLPALPDPQLLDRLEARVLDSGASAKLLVGSSLLDSLDGDSARAIRGVDDQETGHVRAGATPPFAVILADRADAPGDDGRAAVLVVTFDEGGAVHGIVENHAPSALDWGREAFADYWSEGGPLSDEQVETLDGRATAVTTSSSSRARSQRPKRISSGASERVQTSKTRVSMPTDSSCAGS